MARKPQLLDQYGRPVRRAELTQEVAAPTMGGVRSPLTGYPADGLNPVRLANILRSADAGDPVQYLELAETIEERDPHYLGVLGTRKRSVSQIEITVEPGGDDARDEELAELVRDWLKRDELTDELFDILDALGKGYSFTEIIWDTSQGDWWPERLERRDPRWFRFDRHDLATPMLIDETGQEVPINGYQFVFAQMKAKSGLALRSGLARVAAWGWMFKAFTQRDWAIFTQTFAQPLRIGKYGAGASEKDRDTLFNAVAQIAGDCAAIIPETMTIEFVEAGNIGTSHALYKERSDWLDKQISKAVLGQTSTTDAEVGGLGSGKEHREVQEDIERADCRQLSAILNRDLVRPWINLQYGEQPRYPRLVIARPEEEDLKAFGDALAPFIDRGLRVPVQAIYDKFGLPEAQKTDEILRPVSKQAVPQDEDGPESAVKYPFNTRVAQPGPETALQSEGHSSGRTAPPSPTDLQTARLAEAAAPAMAAMLARIEAMMAAAGSLEEFREMLLAGFPEVDASELARVMGEAMVAAHAGGRAMVEEESGG